MGTRHGDEASSYLIDFVLSHLGVYYVFEVLFHSSMGRYLNDGLVLYNWNEWL